MRVFVAGATGVIGQALVPQLREAGHEVVGLTRSQENADIVRRMAAEPTVADALDADALAEVVQAARPDAVIHELTDLRNAFSRRRPDFSGNNRIRREGTRNLVAAAQAVGPARLVAQSIAFGYRPDGRVHGEDDPLYLDGPGSWKDAVAAVQELEEVVTGAGGVVVRYGYFYGPETGFDRDGQWAGLVERRRYPLVRDGAGVFSFVHVDDAARATVLALERGQAGAVYNVVDDEPAPVREWLPVYAEALGAPPPRRISSLAARMAGREAVYMLTRQEGASNAKAKRELGWEPRYPSWREGFAAGF